MSRISTVLKDVHCLDNLAGMNSPVHRLDARVKIIVTLVFIVTVVSFPKYEITELFPLFIFPIFLMIIGHVPILVIMRYLIIASPFVIMVGILNPLLDRKMIFEYGGMGISGGWISFMSIIIKYILTVSASLVLIATTGYISICVSLGRLKIPSIIVMQFLLLYRFIFIILDEGSRMARAHSLRSQDSRRPTIRVWCSLAGHLLLRAYDRGLRLHTAMLNRGFDGEMRSLCSSRLTWMDFAFVVGSIGYFVLIRFGHVTELLGSWTMETIS